MLLAIGGTLLHHGIVDYKWIAIALVLGTIIGVPLGRVQMTAVPQRTALSHAFGALCVTLVGTAEFYLRTPDVSAFMMAVLSAGGHPRIADLHGQPDGRGQAAGESCRSGPSRTRARTSSTCCCSPIARRAGGRTWSLHPERRSSFPSMVVISLAFGVLHDHPHRRRRHADSHLAA